MINVNYDLGDGIRSKITISDDNGAVGDTTEVIFRLQDPNGVRSTVPVIHDGPGLYHVAFSCQVAGTWSWRWEATGPITAAEEGKLNIHPSAFYP
jgi:hypothetical protein